MVGRDGGGWSSNDDLLLRPELWLACHEVASHVHPQFLQALEVSRLQLVLLLLHLQLSFQLGDGGNAICECSILFVVYILLCYTRTWQFTCTGDNLHG